MTFAAAKFRDFLPAATFAMLVEFLMGLSDSIIAGNIVGEVGLSSVNLMQPVMNVVSFFALMVGLGTSVLYASEMGRFNKRRASEILTQGLWSAIGLGAILLVGLALLRKTVISSFGVEGAVFDGVNDFWICFMPCAVLEPVAFFLTSMCYADGDSKTCFASYTGQLVGNCLFSIPLTMYMGLKGCAIGTCIGNVFAILILMVHFRKKSNSLTFVRHFSLTDTMRICACSAGDASIRLCNAALFYLLNLFVVVRFGSKKLPVLAVVICVMGLSEAFDGVANAAQPLAGVYIGEKNDRLVGRIMGYALIVSIAEGLLLSFVMVLFPHLAVKAVGIDDPVIYQSALTAVRIVSLGLVGTSLAMLFNSYYTFLGRIALALTLTVLVTFVAPVVLFPLLGMAFGEIGIWLALAAAPYVAIALVSCFIVVKWGKTMFPYFLNRARERKIRVYDLVLDDKSICALSETVGKFLRTRKDFDERRAGLSALLLEEVLMAIKDRNGSRLIHAEVTLDINDGCLFVTRDDGEIFDITDADAQVSSLRAYLVSNLMTAIPARRNLTTSGFNRNAFRIW